MPIFVTGRGFSGSYSGLNISESLSPSRGDIIRSLLTVGYPSQSASVTAVGEWRAIMLEAMATGYLDESLVPTAYFRRLEQSEKAATTFLLAEAFTHWYAQEKMQMDYLLHVSSLTSCIWKPTGGTPSWKSGALPPADKSRPDFIGYGQGQRHVFESKGRIRKPTQETIKKALGQVSRLNHVNGVAPTTRCACFFQFKASGLSGQVIDPPDTTAEFNVTFDDWEALTRSYAYFLQHSLDQKLPGEVSRDFVGSELQDGLFFAADREIVDALRNRPPGKKDRDQQFKKIIGIRQERTQYYRSVRDQDTFPGRDGIIVLDRRTARSRLI